MALMISALAVLLMLGFPVHALSINLFGGALERASPTSAAVDAKVEQFVKEHVHTRASTALPPIVFFPGLTGSAIVATLDNAPSLYGCERTTTNGRYGCHLCVAPLR